MFTGLSAFPLTPLTEKGIDEKSFVRLMERLVSAGVDSIGALGSTGSYAYLKHSERDRVARLAVEHANGIPVMVSIGSVRTSDVLHLAEDAQRAGVSAVLLAPVSYQKLTQDEVFTLYETVSRHLSVPLCVYDNPATTHFAYTACPTPSTCPFSCDTWRGGRSGGRHGADARRRCLVLRHCRIVPGNSAGDHPRGAKRRCAVCAGTVCSVRAALGAVPSARQPARCGRRSGNSWPGIGPLSAVTASVVVGRCPSASYFRA
ncbi:4-hydroxy-tetrahydrodipicolinate synthase [Rahnella aquatilis]|nr:4-hydroxy-tetrahydrodipicolinate synthase [Rahnella aquatilis]